MRVFKKHICILIAFSLFIILFLGCRKKDDNPSQTAEKLAHVYIAGTVRSVNGKDVATVWENGTPHTLSTGSGYSSANAVTMLGNDIVVAGKGSQENGLGIATIWKNNEPQHIGDPTSYGSEVLSIFAEGNNLYTGGYEQPFNQWTGIAKIWKNNEILHELSDGNKMAQVSAIFFENSTIYSARAEYYLELPNQITLNICKNNSLLYTLTNGNSQAYPYSIYVKGNQIYTAGYVVTDDTIRATVWKNDDVLYTFNSGTSSCAFSLVVKDGDIYVAGYVTTNGYNTATVWKNGQVLHTLSQDDQHAQAQALFILNNDIYTLGNGLNNQGKNVVKCWKNDEVIFEENIESWGNSLYVVEK